MIDLVDTVGILDNIQVIEILLALDQSGWQTKKTDAGKLRLKLVPNGRPQEIIKRTMLTIVRGKEEYCKSLRSIFKGKSLPESHNNELIIPLPIKLRNGDEVRFFCQENGKTKIKEYVVNLTE